MSEERKEIVRNFYHLKRDKGSKKARIFQSNYEFARSYVNWLEQELASFILQENDWNKWITPEKYKQLTGKDWPDDGPVWWNSKSKEFDYDLILYRYCKNVNSDIFHCVIANEHGKPDPDFIPEEAE